MRLKYVRVMPHFAEITRELDKVDTRKLTMFCTSGMARGSLMNHCSKKRQLKFQNDCQNLNMLISRHQVDGLRNGKTVMVFLNVQLKVNLVKFRCKQLKRGWRDCLKFVKATSSRTWNMDKSGSFFVHYQTNVFQKITKNDLILNSTPENRL